MTRTPTKTETEAFAAAVSPDKIVSLDRTASADRAEAWLLSGMIVLAALAMVGTLPGRTHGLGLITEGLLADLQLDRSAFARINLLATLIGAAFCWPCGWLLDRFGIRLTGAVIILLLGISTVGIAQSQTSSALSVWITLTRGFGQSMLSVVSITLCGRASLGLRHATAMAFYSLLVSLMFIAAFRTLGSAIPTMGWRDAWWRLGWIVILAAPVFGLLTVETRSVKKSGEEEGFKQHAVTMRQALGTPAFWVFAVASSMYAFVSSGMSLFNQSILSERQFDASVYYNLLAISTLAGLLGNLGAGWLATRTTYGRLMAIAMTIYALALVTFPWVSNLYQVFAYGIAIGACGGIVTVVFFGVWSYMFGRRNLGKIQGLAQLATVLASAAGPLAFAESMQRFQSYTPVFWMLAPVIAIIATVSWIVRVPRYVIPRYVTDSTTLPRG
jgi:MFS family permease